MTIRLATIACLSLSALACGPTYDHGWEIIGDAPDAYRAEILAAAEVIRAQEGVLHREWGGTITVHPAPFPCPDGIGLCAGWGGDHDVQVVYAPALGLGPAIGTTALAHELCHAARSLRTGDGSSEELANACAARAMPEIAAALTTP